MIPRATYRIQFHAGFTFADAEAIVPYLADLGISHLYASPIATARAGSTHGYDVVDPTRINPELGGEEGFRRLAATLRARGMGVILDIVPNHMGVAGGGNAWWNDVLAKGRDSAYARFFDIDWRERIMLPILGDPLETALAEGALRVDRVDGRAMLVAYDEHRLPLRAEDQADAGHDNLRGLLDRQHYQLACWRSANDDLNWRRFFTINDLAGLRIEDPAVFDATHALVIRLYAEGLIDGVRVDHVDGLTDPAGYCRTLRDRLDAVGRPAPAYIVVEKILAAGEPLATDWGIDGTSGYDFMEQVGALLHAPGGAEPLATLWAEISDRPSDFASEELRARQELLASQFEGQLARCVEAFDILARSTSEAIASIAIRRAIERMLWVFPVYRTYGTGTDAPLHDAAIRASVRVRVLPHLSPGEGAIVERILDWLAGEGGGDPALAAEAVRRFQQLSAPIAAKAVEDTAFYRYGRLLSRNDVGSDPAILALAIADFHAAMANRAATWPHSMLATSTHDHKRGEDVRARLAVLSEMPDLWSAHVRAWLDLAGHLTPSVDRTDVYMLLQTLIGAWPEGLAIDDTAGLIAFADRVIAWQDKALREARLRSSWETPDTIYEAECADLVRALLDPKRGAAFLGDAAALLQHIHARAQANGLVQTVLKYTLPGVPDLYQGTELADHSLVDPDNRRPVDYAKRRQALTNRSDEKLAVIADLLAARRAHPTLFADGDYQPLAVTGPYADQVLAFRRAQGSVSLTVAVALHLACRPDAEIPADGWTATRLETGEDLATISSQMPYLIRITPRRSDP